MNHSLEHLSDGTLSARLDEISARDRGTTVEMLAHIAEFDRRKLYAPAGYSCMHGYCVDRLRMSDDVVFARIRVARASRRFPGILDAIQDGRLNITSVVLLSPHLKVLSREAGRELLRAAVNKRIREIRVLLAQRFPQPDVPTLLVPLGPPQAPADFRQLGLNPVAGNDVEASAPPATPDTVPLSIAAPAVVATVPSSTAAPRALIAPLSPGRFKFQMTIGQGVHDKLHRFRALLGHEVSGDLEQVFERALDIAIAHVEKRKYGATDRPRPGRPSDPDSRHTPADVRRAVRERDQDRCTYVSPDGRRCEERSSLQFAHIKAYARGGGKTAINLRLLCPAHNQYEAEQLYGAQFMENKKEQSLERKRAG